MIKAKKNIGLSHSPSIIFIFLILVFGFSIGCNNKTDKSDENETVRVGITNSYLGEAATFVAREQGFFEEHGLNVRFVQNSSGRISILELFDGTVDIAHVAETPVVYSLIDSSYYQGKVPDFRIFADMIYADEIQQIIGLRSHGISKPQDLKGKTIATYSGTQLDYFFDSFLLEYEIPKSSINTIDIPPSEQQEAIEKGEVDAVIPWEPYATYIYQMLGDDAVFLNTKLTYSTLWLATTLNAYAENHPKVLVKYLKAIREAQIFISENPHKARQIIANQMGIPLDVVQASWGEIDYELSLSERMVTLLDDQTRWLKRKGEADTPGIDFRSLIYYEPMEEVYPQGITVIR